MRTLDSQVAGDIFMVTIKRQRLKGTRQIEDMTEAEAAYIAGIVDGEGCLHLRRTGYPYLSVKMCSLVPVQLAETWGGTLHERPPYPHQKRSYRWRVSERQRLRSMLKKLVPFLQEKRRQAQICLEALDILDVKAEGWKDRLKPMVVECSALKRREPPHIDLKTLKTAWEPTSS